MAEETVLLVDDEQAFIDALADALEFLRYRVLRVASVEDALRILETTRVDAVTVDMMLTPGETLEATVSSQEAGLYLLDQMRIRYSQVPAVCISVVSDPATISAVRRLGFGFLRKGDTPLRTVLQRIEELLRKRGGRGEALKRLGKKYRGKL